MIHLVLVEPEIPANTGNVARTCAVTGAQLHLIRPLGFSIDDKQLKRAGLDYWHLLNVQIHDSLEDFFKAHPQGPHYLLTTKASKNYTDVEYPEDVYFLFGRETRGLPEDLIREHLDTAIRIPMRKEARSLNLSNSVAIVAYEALRQRGFDGLLCEGKLPE